MGVKVFDVVGVIAVGAWLTAVGLYFYEINFAQDEAVSDQPNGIVISAGNSWMLLTRDDEQVGIIHETRTSIEEGWLLEYDFLLNVATFGSEQLLETSIKATVDKDAYLQKVSGTVQTALTSFSIAGRVQDTEVVLSYTIDGNEREKRIPIKEPPRLANSVFNQLAAERDKLTPGAIFEQEYFDPMIMGMTKMRFQFVREHQIDVYDKKIDAYHFKQQISGTELDVYVDASGEVHIQELPLRIVAARIPESLGQARAQALENKFKSAAKRGTAEISVDEAVGLIRGSGSITSRTRYQLTNIPETLSLRLDSTAQKMISRKEDSVIVDTSQPADAQLSSEAELTRLRQPAESYKDLKGLADLIPIMKDAQQVQRAEKLGRNVRDAFEFDATEPFVGIEDALESGRGNSQTLAEVLVAAMRVADIPARFVLGVEETEDGSWAPRYWVQFWRTDRWADIDPGRTTLLPGTSQIQLTVSAELETGAFLAEFNKISIERVAAEAAADFN